MASDSARVRRVDELLLSASDVGVVDRAALSLWHFQQLLRPHFPARDLLTNADGLPAEITDDKENRTENEPWRASVPTIDLDDGMAVAALTFLDDHAKGEDSGGGNHGKVDDSLEELEEDSTELDDATSIRFTRITQASKVSVVYQRYKCVISLDASPSALSIDMAAGKVSLDVLYESVELFVRSLLRPMQVGYAAFEPELYVSVVIQGAFVDSLCVLLQSFLLHERNVDNLLRLVRDRLARLEDEWAATKAIPQSQNDSNRYRHRSSLTAMLQNAVYALNSLPSGATPMIVLATDGVVDFFSGNTYDGLLMQLIRHDVQCNFIRVGGSSMSASFGFVPDFDLLEFVAQTSGGSVIDYVALQQGLTVSSNRDKVKCMTQMQAQLLVRYSTIQAISTPVLKLDASWCASFDGSQYLPLRPYRMWRQKVHEYRIQTDVDRIVEARIREGFVVNKVHIRMMQKAQDGSLVKVPQSATPIGPAERSDAAVKVLLVFVLQWKQGVWIEYVISSTIDFRNHTRSGLSRSSSVKQSSNQQAALGQVKRDHPAASEWFVKVNVLADAEFLRAFDESRSQANQPTSAASMTPPTTLHDFVRNVQDVDRVLLHLMTAAASLVSEADLSSQFSFGTQVSHAISTNQNLTQKSQATHPVFGIIGDLSPVLWHRWFHVERFEVLSVVADTPSAGDFYPRTVMNPMGSRDPVMMQQRNHPPRLNQRRRQGASVEAGAHPLLVGADQNLDRVRTAILRWSTQRLSKDLYLRFLTADTQRADAKSNKTTAAQSVAPVAGGLKRRQQRGSLNSATLSVQIASSLDQAQSASRRDDRNGALCFVRIEVKNRTLVILHVAFFSSSSVTRREIMAELKSIISASEVSLSGTQRTSVGGIQSSAAAVPRPIVLCHRMISRLLVTHDTLTLGIDDPQDEHSWNSAYDPEKPLVACCGGSELQIRSVFGAFMWHSSWNWRLLQSSSTSITELMRHLHEARVRAGFWVLDWKLEDDGGVARVSSVIFGREILMEDEAGNTKTSLLQYGMKRTSDQCLVTSLWMEPQYGFAKTTLAKDIPEAERADNFTSGLLHAVGHSAPMISARRSSKQPSNGFSAGGDVLYMDEGHLLQLVRQYVFDSDRHILSCLQTFETVLTIREGSVGALPPQSEHRSVVGDEILAAISATQTEDAPSKQALVPAFSTVRLLQASKRSTEHFLMYLERGVSTTSDPAHEGSPQPDLSAANRYLYSMLEQTLRSLSDCEVAWTDASGDYVNGSAMKHDVAQLSPSTSHFPVWFARNFVSSALSSDHVRSISDGRCFAKLLPNDTVMFAFLPAVSTLQLKKRSQPSPVNASAHAPSSTLERWQQRHLLKSTASLEATDSASSQATSSTSVLRMSVSADDIVLYQERRKSFREGYKSWRMGMAQGAREDKSHRTGATGSLSPHPKVVTFSEDYEFCDALCGQAEVGCDFHLLIEKADGALGSGYFQVAFYECSLEKLSSAIITGDWSSGELSPVYQSILMALFERRERDILGAEDVAIEAPRLPPLNRQVKKDPAFGFGNRPGSQPPPSPITVPSPTTLQPGSDASVLSSSIVFRKKVKRAHEHNFSRGVYMALRDSSPVEQSDLIQALSSCVEVPMDMDITLLYRMLQVDMIRTSMPRTALRSSMIDLLSGKSIRDALKQRLDKSLETILASAFRGIDGTKYYVFFGSESMAVDDVVGLADNEYESEPFVVDGESMASAGAASQPPRLLKSVTISGESRIGQDADDNQEDVGGGESDLLTFDGPPDAQQEQISQEEDVELNKDVAAATSSFSAPFFFRFECREVTQEPDNRMRSTSTGGPNAKPSQTRPVLPRSASTKSFMDGVDPMRPSPKAGTPPVWQSTSPSLAGIAASPVGGVGEIAEWAMKNAAPKIALRLMTLTLPNEQLLEQTHGQHAGLTVDDHRVRPTAAELFSSLPFFQRQVLKRMRKSIKEWSSAEILRILRSGDRLTVPIATLVNRLFADLPAASLTTVKYPLDFVGANQENLDPHMLVKKELETGADGLQTIKCGDLYFVVSRRDGDAVEIPYWAIFTVEKDYIKLQLHHPSSADAGEVEFNRLAVLTSLHLGVNAICKRVNQSLLLMQLHETRSCNEWLIPADPGTQTSTTAAPASPTSAAKASSARAFFWPGQFECDVKYSAFFRLNERMVPSIALTMLSTQALEQFQVHNRRHVFVYRDRGGHVFYMKMSVSTREEENTRQQGSATVPALFRSSSAPCTGAAPASGILLRVYGVCAVGEEVTVELCRVLERKLDEAMQQILMKLLARNTKFQLNATDMAFACAPVTSPASVVVYDIAARPEIQSGAPALLPFLCHTLSMTSYIRQILTPLPTAQSLVTRERDVSDPVKLSAEVPGEQRDQDASVMHPAMFASRQSVIAETDAAVCSPVFFTRQQSDIDEADEATHVEVVAGPSSVVLDHATFAINLNPELRLSPGFLTRVGKGLAILDVELVEQDRAIAATEAEEASNVEVVSLNLPRIETATADGTEGSQRRLQLRCRLWIRGPVQVPVLREVYESHIKEALTDVVMESVIKQIRAKQQKATSEHEAANLPSEWKTLTALLETAAGSSSASVTKLALPMTLPSWDLKNVVNQVNGFLRNAMPASARPAKYVYRKGEFEHIEQDAWLGDSDVVKLVPAQLPSEGVVSLAHSESIQSDLSEAESMTSSRASLGSSTIESLSAAAFFTMGQPAAAVTREYSMNEVTFYPNAKPSASDSGRTAAHSRSFYYVVDISTSGGVVLYGYNLSVQVMESTLSLLARVLTWCLLRDQLLRCLLLQRGGVVYASPSGAPIVQPRTLLQQHGHGRIQPADYSVSFVEFKPYIVAILQEHAIVPKTLDMAAPRLLQSAFGKMMKEMGVQFQDAAEQPRSRTSSARFLDDSSSRRVASSSGMRGGRGSLPPSVGGSSKSLVAASTEGAAAARPTGAGMTVPSPTKRLSAGGNPSTLSLAPSGNAGGLTSGGSAVAAARMRNNPSATNALLAARARARGSGFPGRMGAGPGVSASRSNAPGEVAPWDLPVTNTKASAPPTPLVAATATQETKADDQPKAMTVAGAEKKLSVDKAPVPHSQARTLVPVSRSQGGEHWLALVEQSWGPRHKFCSKNAFVAGTLKLLTAKPAAKGSLISDAKSTDPLSYFAGAFVKHQDMHESCSAVAENSLDLFKRIQGTTAIVGSSIDISSETAVRSMVDIGHVIVHQRFRVSYIERWEVVKIDEEYVDDGSNTGRLRALQASMDLVNLLSYKQEFVFVGNERIVAKLLTEHTVQAMSGKEGQAVREMKLQILKAVFHSRMEVVHKFFEQYAVHLRALGFYHLRSPSSRLGRKLSTAATIGSSVSASGSSTPTSVGTVATDGEAFTEWFVHSGTMVRGKTTGVDRSQRGSSRGGGAASGADGVLVLELKCDFSGVQVNVVIVSEADLKQQHMGHQRHLEGLGPHQAKVSGAMVAQAGQLLRQSLNTKALVHDFTIRFFHQCLLDWTWTVRKTEDEGGNRPVVAASSSALHNMVKGIRCFLHMYPQSPSSTSAKPRECLLETATVELPVRNLQSDYSESILVKILLRYIACHSSRYDVNDLTQFGTPDTLACHSIIGNFFNRQPPTTSTASSRARPGSKLPGYSLLITTQELWKGRKRPKSSVLLALVRSPPLTPSSTSGVAGIGSALLLPMDRAMQEAELFVKELFRAAAANYERDLLWSRLLYNDSQGLTADVAQSLSLPVEHFRVEVGPQQLEECLRLSVCIPLQKIDPELSELLSIDGVCWQEFALRLRDAFAGQLREYQFDGQAACHFLLLCPNARDLIIHLTFPSGITSAAVEGEGQCLLIDVCRREEPATGKFSLAQRRAITEFVNSVVHWLWRCLLYD